MRMSDMIEEFIKDLFEEEKDIIEIQRFLHKDNEQTPQHTDVCCGVLKQ